MSKVDEIAQKIDEIERLSIRLSYQQEEIEKQQKELRHQRALLHDEMANARLEEYGLSLGTEIAFTTEALECVNQTLVRPLPQVGDVFKIETVIRNTIMLQNEKGDVESLPLTDAGKLQKVVGE